MYIYLCVCKQVFVYIYLFSYINKAQSLFRHLTGAEKRFAPA